jgi:DNA modification methylase
VTVLLGDCLAVLPTLAAESVDAIVCDPPYGLSFMGKNWDHGIPGVAFWEAALRVAKPGAHLVAFGGTRTFHRLACAIEDAGWEIRDTLMWVYGSGFPKSLDVSKALDKRGGADIGWFGPWLRQERQRRGLSSNDLGKHFPSKTGGPTGCVRNWELGLNIPTPDQFNLLCDVLGLSFARIEEAERAVLETRRESGKRQVTILGTEAKDYDVTAPACDAAKQWAGWGTALKPSWEPIILARKPLAGTVAQTVARYGTGAINVDGCRIGAMTDAEIARSGKSTSGMFGLGAVDWKREGRRPIKLCTCEHLSGTSSAPTAGETTPPEGAASPPSTATASVERTRNGKDAGSPADTSRAGTGCSAGMSAAAPSEAPATPTNSSTAPSGKPHTDPCPPTALSTTSMRTSETTDSKTCTSCGGQITSPTTTRESLNAGRWPANVVLSHSPACRQVGTRRVKATGAFPAGLIRRSVTGVPIGTDEHRETRNGMGDADGLETVPAWECDPDCAVRLLDEQSGERKSGKLEPHHRRHTAKGWSGAFADDGEGPAARGTFGGDTGGASRFMYCAKASKAERWEYLSCDCEAPIFPAWVNAVRSRSGQTASTSRERATSGATLTDGSASPTSPSGSASTGASPLGSKSITSTETSRTTDWTTSASSVPPSTSASIPDASCAATAGGSRAASAASSSPSDPTTGTSPQTATRSMGVAVPATSLRSSEPSNCGNCGKPLQRAGHPTVKPLALMRWLCRLVTPPGGTILDPFCGSGSTGCAAALEGFRFLGIEREAEYVAIAERRIAHWTRVGQRYARLLAYRAAHPPEARAPVEDPDQITLFGPAA